MVIENNSWLCTWVLAQLWSGLELESPRPLSPQRVPLGPTTLRTEKGDQIRMQKSGGKDAFSSSSVSGDREGMAGTLASSRSCRRGLVKTDESQWKMRIPTKVSSPRSLSIVLGQERRAVAFYPSFFPESVHNQLQARMLQDTITWTTSRPGRWTESASY